MLFPVRGAPMMDTLQGVLGIGGSRYCLGFVRNFWWASREDRRYSLSWKLHEEKRKSIVSGYFHLFCDKVGAKRVSQRALTPQKTQHCQWGSCLLSEPQDRFVPSGSISTKNQGPLFWKMINLSKYLPGKEKNDRLLNVNQSRMERKHDKLIFA